MRRVPALALLLSLIAIAPLGAQTVRGSVVDDSTKLPVMSVLIALVDAAGREVPGVRSDSLGAFIVHAARPGTYRVRATRIGYRQMTSEPVTLTLGQLAVVRLRMTTVAQQLVPIRVVERRALSAAELMSKIGFDLRHSKGLGLFLTQEQLEAMGSDAVSEIIASQLRPTLYVENDPILGEVIRIRQGIDGCVPEIYLDGMLISRPPEALMLQDSASLALVTRMDTLRARTRGEADQSRVASSQGYALSVLLPLQARDLHGIEVYRSNQIPPASLGAWFGATKPSIKPCGTLAIWTKDGGRRPAGIRGTPRGEVQVISGTVVNFDTGEPLAGVPVRLMNSDRKALADPVRSDARGEFTIRTQRAGNFRLWLASVGYRESITPLVSVAADEVVMVKLFASPSQPVLAPLAIAARVLPQTFGITSLGGFTYRRERGLDGSFYVAEDIERAGARSLGALVGAIPEVRISGPAPMDTITFLRRDDLPRCKPLYYIDGKRVTANVEATIAGLSMAQLFGVEVYTKQEDVPAIFTDAEGDCGLIAIWSRL